MNKTLKYALAAIMTVAFVAPVMAQDNFPDVPDNHWAYEALGKMMKDGILVGYPDGLFRGPRPASRYELAVAVNAAYQKLAGQSAGLSEKIDQLQKMVEGAGNGADLQDLKAQLTELKSSVDGMKGYGADIANLQKLANTFEKELASLGVDVEKMKTDLTDLSKRVEALEKIKPAVAISGDVNLLVLAGHSTDDKFGITPSGKIVGVGTGAYHDMPVGLDRNLNVLHEAALTFKGTNEEGPKWHATMVIGNLFPTVGDMNTGALGGAFDGDQATDITFETFGVSFDTSLLGQGFSAEVGRLGYQVGNYFLKRPDYTDYYVNDRWDNGNYLIDGALLKFKFGAVGLDLIVGENSKLNNDKGTDINPISLAGTGAKIDQTLGAVLGVSLGEWGTLKGTYLFQNSNNTFTLPGVVGTANRMNTFGGELNLGYENFKLDGSYAKTQYTYNTSSVQDSDNDAYDVALSYANGNWGAGAGYREIKSYFGAAGDWGRIGTAWNPTNIKGWTGNVYLQATPGLTIKAKGEWAEPKDAAYGVGAYAAGVLDKVESYVVGMDYKLNTNWTVGLSYEDVTWKVTTGAPDARERWYGINLGYNLGPNSALRVGYQLSDNDYTQGAAETTANRFKGGLFTTQLSVKF